MLLQQIFTNLFHCRKVRGRGGGVLRPFCLIQSANHFRLALYNPMKHLCSLAMDGCAYPWYDNETVMLMRGKTFWIVFSQSAYTLNAHEATVQNDAKIIAQNHYIKLIVLH